MAGKYVSFQVGEGLYAIALEDVAQITRYETSTAVPSAPPFVQGVINLGAEVVPLVDLGKRLAASSEAPRRGSRVIVAEREGRRYGLLVDAVRGILELDESNISKEVAGVLGLKAQFALGVAKIRDRLLVLLDVFALLGTSSEESFREPAG